MRPLVLFALSLGLSVPASAADGAPTRNADNHCMSGVETVVFHCATSKGKWISVCADAQSANPGFVSYRYGAKGKIELQKPDADAGNLAKWKVQSQMLARGESRTLKFTNEGYAYEVFITEAGMDTSAGVVVSKGDKPLATLTCANQTWTDDFSIVEKAKKAAAQ